jgi:hypothetical protein
MKKVLFISLIITIASIVSIVQAQEVNGKRKINPFSCESEAEKISKENNVSQVIQEINRKIKEADDAQSFCLIAELMKRVGNYEATKYYEKAIKAAPSEPAYELFYARYLRNFRGPQRPLFPEAEEHYFKALELIEINKSKNDKTDWDKTTEGRVERELITLYQEDGLPLIKRKWSAINSNELKKPFASLTSINQFVAHTTDLDRVDDTRDFTSEALFAQSANRLNRNLSRSELKGIVRTKTQFETFNRLRLRYDYLPVIDLFYKYRQIDNAVIPNFFEPNLFKDVRLNEFGIAIEKPFNFNNYCDFFIKGFYKRIERQGNIEFFPNNRDDINQFEVKAAISKNIGPDKAIFEVNYAYQDINPNPNITTPVERDRNIFAATLTYQIFRPIPLLHQNLQTVYGERFTTRGVDVFGGFALDKERFGTVDVNKRDYFVGFALKGLRGFGERQSCEIRIQPTIFTGQVKGDSSQTNAQYRTNVLFLYRLLDEEKHLWEIPKGSGIYLAFAHLVFPFRHDVAIDGPNYFQNFRMGVGLDLKWFINSGLRTSFLTSMSYEFQRFYNLDENLSLYKFLISMGF